MRRRDLGLRGGGSGVPRGVSFSSNENSLRSPLGGLKRRTLFGASACALLSDAEGLFEEGDREVGCPFG